MRVNCVIATKKLGVQAETLSRDVERGEVECFQLDLVGRRVNVGKPECRVDIELYRAILTDVDVLGELATPVKIPII